MTTPDENQNKGYPEHGEEYHEEKEGKEPDKQEDDETVEEEHQGEEDLRLLVSRLQGEINVLKSRPALAPVQERKEEPPKERDWEKLMFEDTPNAVKMLKEDIRREITTELRGAYQKDMGEKEFWNEFYSSHADLKEDQDLVRATLGSNMTALQDLPVSEAAKKLADLTRARILRYKGGEVDKKNEKKPKVEGSGAPTGKGKTPEAPKILSLGDVIRARRAARNKKAVTA